MGLFSAIPTELTGFKANVAITRANVKQQSIADAQSGDATKEKNTTDEDVQGEAKRQNAFRLACIGAKESIAKEMTDRAGGSIINPLLRHPDGVRMKKVNEHHLHELVKAVMEEASRPGPIKIRQQIATIMDFTFDWRETAAANLERLSADIAKANAFGIEIKSDLKAVILLVNVAAVVRFSSGGIEVREALRTIKAAYAYNHKHGGASIAAIMKFLAATDKQCNRMAAPAPGNMANMTTDKLLETANKGYSTSKMESAIMVMPGTKSLIETRRERLARKPIRMPIRIRGVPIAPHERATVPAVSCFDWPIYQLLALILLTKR